MVDNVFVVMPAYNAGATIESVFARVPERARSRIKRFIVVDDGSTDDTGAVLERIAENFPNLSTCKHERNKGYGAAEKTLLTLALSEDAQVVVLLHADGQYSPEKIPELLEPFDRDDADLVQGSRMLEGGALDGGMPLYKFLANKCLTALENWAFGLNMAEYHSGFMLYSRKFLENVPFERLSDSFEFDLEMIVAARILGFRIQEIAIPTIYAEEKSHLNPIKYGLDVLRIVARFRRGVYHDLLETRVSGREAS